MIPGRLYLVGAVLLGAGLVVLAVTATTGQTGILAGGFWLGGFLAVLGAAGLALGYVLRHLSAPTISLATLRRLAVTGYPGTAEVRSIRHTPLHTVLGVWTGLTLAVHGPEPYETEVVCLVPRHLVILPGVTYRVLIDPQDRRRVGLVFGTPTRP